MKFLLISALLGVAIAACDALTVNQVKDKINGIQDISQIDFIFPGHGERPITYNPVGGLLGGFGVPGTLYLDDVHILNISDIQVNGIIIKTGDVFEIPLHCNYNFDVLYRIHVIPHLMLNDGKAFGEVKNFSGVIAVKIAADGAFQLVKVISVTLGSVKIDFSHSKLSPQHDLVFNALQSTFKTIVEQEARTTYAEHISVKIFSYVKSSD